MSRKVVTKANALVKASYRLTLTEMQITLYGVSLINPKAKEFPLEYEIEISKFATMFDRKHGEIYQDIKDAVLKKFWLRDIRYWDEETGKDTAIRWLTKIAYSDKSGSFKLKFSEEVKPFLHELAKNFTVYYIDQIAKFKSIYSVRIYEYAIMEINKFNKEVCYFEMPVDDIRKRLELENKYSRHCDLKQYVINKAQSEINSYSDLNLEYEEIKLGRAVDKIKFIITRKAGVKRARYEAHEQLNHEPVAEQKPALPTEEEMSLYMKKGELKLQLMRYGVSEKVAYNLTEDYSFDRIEQAIKLIRQDHGIGKISNPAAYLVSAIKEEYSI